MDKKVEKGNKSPLQVDADFIVTALQSNDGMIVWFLDLETGEGGMYCDGMLNAEDVGDDFDIDDYLEGDRYRLIEGIGSPAAYRVMEDFVDSLTEGRAKNVLVDAITGRKPFRSFKDALLDLGEVRDQWFAFEALAYNKMAQEWLDEEGINARLIVPTFESPPES